MKMTVEYPFIFESTMIKYKGERKKKKHMENHKIIFIFSVISDLCKDHFLSLG